MVPCAATGVLLVLIGGGSLGGCALYHDADGPAGQTETRSLFLLPEYLP
jgi:hypothetical protein